MSKLDIRLERKDVETVLFDDPIDNRFNATEISKLKREFGGICVSHSGDMRLIIYTKESAQNLIKAVQYAIANDWFKQ